jgi:predicted DNA-binding protein (UPF0251 family)
MIFALTLSAQAVIAAANRAQAEATRYQVVADATSDVWPFNEAGRFTIFLKADPQRRYRVTLPGVLPQHPEGKCSCPAWQANGVCKHVFITLEEAEILAREAENEEQEEAASFMRECSREHAVGFTAEILDDVAAAWPTCSLHGPYEAADNGSPMLSCDRCEEYRF